MFDSLRRHTYLWRAFQTGKGALIKKASSRRCMLIDSGHRSHCTLVSVGQSFRPHDRSSAWLHRCTQCIAIVSLSALCLCHLSLSSQHSPLSACSDIRCGDYRSSQPETSSLACCCCFGSTYFIYLATFTM